MRVGAFNAFEERHGHFRMAVVGYFHAVVYRRRAEQGDGEGGGIRERAVESRGCLLAAQGCSTWNIQRIQVCYSERGGWLEWDVPVWARLTGADDWGTAARETQWIDDHHRGLPRSGPKHSGTATYLVVLVA